MAKEKWELQIQSGLGSDTRAENGEPIASEYQVSPSQVSEWKKGLQSQGASLFEGQGTGKERQQEQREAELYEQIGRLKMELEWLKKSIGQRAEEKRRLVEPGHEQISLRRQCDLVGLNRASDYNQPAGESALNLALMRKIDKQYLQTPFYGWPRMTAYLKREGYAIKHKRVQRLRQQMGIQAIYPRPRPQTERHSPPIYPYLLEELEVERPNQIWSSDITSVLEIGITPQQLTTLYALSSKKPPILPPKRQ